MAPASIRHKNPGAMGLGRAAKKWGATKVTRLNDGQGNTIATFPTHKAGAAAIWELLSRPIYFGKTIAAAIEKWSGGNHVNAYLENIEAWSGYSRHDYVDLDLIEDPDNAIAFAQAMARHEAGKEYPMAQDDWYDAHDKFMEVRRGGQVLAKPDKDGEHTKAVELARTFLGIKEIRGKKDNPEIVALFETVGSDVRDDETPWCAAFVGAMLARSGYSYLERNLLALEYKKYGVACDIEIGAIVVMKRGSKSWQGHVGFVHEFDSKYVYCLGGNQSNSVSIMRLNRNDPRILAYRRPVYKNMPVGEVLEDQSIRYKAVGFISTISVALASAWDVIMSMFGSLPTTAAAVRTATDSAKGITSAAGLPWPAYAAMAIAIAALGYNFYETWKRKRDRK